MFVRDLFNQKTSIRKLRLPVKRQTGNANDISRKCQPFRVSEVGETIVEVLISSAIIGIVLVATFVIANRSLNIGQSASERTQVQKMLETQMERLKVLASADDRTGPTGVFGQGSTPFCIAAPSGGSLTVTTNIADPDCYDSSFPSSNLRIEITYDADGPNDGTNVFDDNTFTAVATWDRIGGGVTEIARIYYRIHPLAYLPPPPVNPPNIVLPPPTCPVASDYPGLYVDGTPTPPSGGQLTDVNDAINSGPDGLINAFDCNNPPPPGGCSSFALILGRDPANLIYTLNDNELPARYLEGSNFDPSMPWHRTTRPDKIIPAFQFNTVAPFNCSYVLNINLGCSPATDPLPPTIECFDPNVGTANQDAEAVFIEFYSSSVDYVDPYDDSLGFPQNLQGNLFATPNFPGLPGNDITSDPAHRTCSGALVAHASTVDNFTAQDEPPDFQSPSINVLLPNTNVTCIRFSHLCASNVFPVANLPSPGYCDNLYDGGYPFGSPKSSGGGTLSSVYIFELDVFGS